jgi:hypothetical protein
MNRDYTVIRELVQRYAEYAALPQQETNRTNWRKLNGLESGRPMVMIDQLPWHELNSDGELTLACDDPFLRSVENALRQTLYKWEHIPADMVLDPFIRVPKAYSSSGYGVESADHAIALDDKNTSAQAHEYQDKIRNDGDLALFQTPVVTHDRRESQRRKELCQEIFGDILPVYLTGHVAYSHVWDIITTFRGVTPVYFDLADRPDFVAETIHRFVEMHMGMLDQMEEQGLLEANDLVHCTGAYVDELPATQRLPEEDSISLKSSECWTYAASQLFASVSPEMHRQYDIEPMMPIYRRFGLVYYGCCEPLDNKIEIIRAIPNVRKISISPWADPFRAAEQLRGDYVLSRKPTPAVLAESVLDEERVRKDIRETLRACRQSATPCEIILKDVSTVSYRPQNLIRWERLVRDTIENS